MERIKKDPRRKTLKERKHIRESIPDLEGGIFVIDNTSLSTLDLNNTKSKRLVKIYNREISLLDPRSLRKNRLVVGSLLKSE